MKKLTLISLAIVLSTICNLLMAQATSSRSSSDSNDWIIKSGCSMCTKSEIIVDGQPYGGNGITLKAGDGPDGSANITLQTETSTGDILFKQKVNYYTSETVMVVSNHNVGIKTTSPDYDLEVNGTIKTEELIVENVEADFVFAEDYNLRSLQEVESYINDNGHLPDIAPASETSQGIKISEFNTLMLQKIEELTLYMIELKKENEELKVQINTLNNQ